MALETESSNTLETSMNHTGPKGHRLSKLSLYYLVGYLCVGGVGLAAQPQLALHLLQSNGDYGSILPRMVGVLMLGMAMLVTQIMRHGIHTLYPTAMAVRTMFCAAMLWLFTLSHDPLFVTLFGIIGTGVILTATGYAIDRRRGWSTLQPTPREWTRA
jgi:hypothetical protein